MPYNSGHRSAMTSAYALSDMQKRMSDHETDPWHIWSVLVVAKIPIKLVIDPSKIKERKETNRFDFSDTAFVHRIFDLLFTLRDPKLQNELTEEERKEVSQFFSANESLPWKAIPSHPHISELEDIGQLSRLQKEAERIDEMLERRTSMKPKSMWYRFRKGWPILEPKRKHIQSVHTTPASAPR